MGVLETIPEDLSIFYNDDYYGTGSGGARDGYSDYEFTATHSLMWLKLYLKLYQVPGTILDVGCADGYLLADLPTEFQRYGIEASRKASFRAEQRGIRIISNDLLSLENCTELLGKFDIVTSIATFEHLKDFRKSIELCLNFLNPTGILIFEVPLLSERADNETWFTSSLEHVWYPTLQGIDWLLSRELGVHFSGGEIHIKGFASNYICFVTKSEITAKHIRSVYNILIQSDPTQLGDEECALNLAFNVGHAFDVSPNRILMLPKLLKHEASFNFLTRLTHLWHADSLASAQLDWYRQTLEEANEYGLQQAKSVEQLLSTTKELEERVALLESKLRATR